MKIDMKYYSREVHPEDDIFTAGAYLKSVITQRIIIKYITIRFAS